MRNSIDLDLYLFHFFCCCGAIFWKKSDLLPSFCCRLLKTHTQIQNSLSVRLIKGDVFWEKSAEKCRLMRRAAVKLCERLCPVQCNSQSCGLWQRCMSMSCCCGIGEEPSGTDALLRKTCEYCWRVPEGVLTTVFFKPEMKLKWRVLVRLLLHNVSALVGPMSSPLKKANEAKRKICHYRLNQPKILT